MRVVIPWAGEIDLASGSQLQADTCKALGEADVDEVELNLSEVTFLDSSGLSALLVIRGCAIEAGIRLLLSGVSDQFTKLLTFTGLGNMFEVV